MPERTPAGSRRFRARRCDVDGGGCGLRFPVEDGSPLGASCPLCGAPTRFVDTAWATHEVTRADAADVSATDTAPPHVGALGALLDNVRSLRNVGSMFRTADGVGMRLVVLGGVTPTPAHPGFAKTALGAEHSVPWQRFPDAVTAATACLEQGWTLWALEGGRGAHDLFAPDTMAAARGRSIMLVLGHEVSGVDPRIAALCERVVFIPMLGRKGSLNVSVAFGVAAYAVRAGLAAGS